MTIVRSVRSRALSFALMLPIATLPAQNKASSNQQSQDRSRTVVRVPLEYAAPTDGKPNPNFSPKGTQIVLADIDNKQALPAGAWRPAKRGVMKLGDDRASWIPVLATACVERGADLCQIFVDRNANGDFADDGPALTATPAQNAKTKAWWSSVSRVSVSVRYRALATTQPYLVNFWSVRDDSTAAPDVLRFSVASWRSGVTEINGVKSLVAAMDGDNNAIFDKADMWSVLAASAPDAEKSVLSISEARATNRLMFVTDGAKDIPLEFRGFTADGSAVEFTVVPREITKLSDRAPDDLVREERIKPRTEVPVVWGNELASALAQAKSAGKAVFIDFEATWCGPCHSMDQWVWNDVEVAQRLRAGFVTIKVDADLQKALVKRLKIVGYPTMMIMKADGTEVRRVDGYQSSKQITEFLK